MKLASLVHRKFPKGTRNALWSFAVILSALAVFWVCTYKIMDRDFWWHITSGKIMLQTHALIGIDPFAYTRSGLPYLATHEWLAQIVLHLLYHIGGPVGIILFRGVIACTSVGLLLLLAKRKRLTHLLLALWAVVMTKGSFLERPQLFTFVFFSAFVLMAFRFLDAASMRRRMQICAAFVGLELLWVNMHGGAALLGCAIVAFLLLQSAANARRHYERNESIRSGVLLACTLLAMGIALVLPPNGLGTLSYLSQLLNDQTIAFIAEWQPRGWLPYMADVWLFFGVAITALLLGRKHWVFNGLLLLATAYLSRQAVRHEILFVFASIGTAFYQFDRSACAARVDTWMTGRKRVLAIVVGVALTLYGAHVAVERSYEFERRDNLFGFGQFDLARGATDFVEQEKITGNMFNTYGIGGYLIYRGYPDRKVFLDGRNVDYGFDYLAHAYAAGVDPAHWKTLEDKYGFTYAMVDYDAIRREKDLPYSTILDTDAQWPLVYLDDWVAVYLKNTPANQPLIKKWKYTLVSPTKLQFDDGFDSVSQLDIPTVIRELNRVRESNPQGVKATLSLAKIALRQGRKEDVIALTAEVMRLRPAMPEPYAILATQYINEGKWKEAADAYLTLLALAGKNYPNLNYGFISAVFDKAGYTWSAWLYRPAGVAPASQKTGSGAAPSLAVNPVQDSVSFNDLGIAQAQSGSYVEAEQSFRTAIALNPSNGAVWNNLCALYVSMQKNADALESCQRAVDADPKSADAHFNFALAYYHSNALENAERETALAKKLGRTEEADKLLLLIRKKSSQ